jgi:ribonuclease D
VIADGASSTGPSPRNVQDGPGNGPTESDPPPEQVAVLLRVPRDGTPKPVTRRAELDAAIAGLAAGTGPLAVDAERASGYRYSQRAYLVQLRRAGYGTALVDPITLPDLSELGTALRDLEWILHAATQDLPCLADVGMIPTRLFDTELAGRLLGSERVALGTMVQQYLGIRLEKGHSAADWSTRPLPREWLDYAALDVELLAELREELATALDQDGKLDWAAQEFQAILDSPPAPARAEPWRRLSGIHSLRTRRQLAVARSLWTARDMLARERDVAPGRVLPDAAVISAVKTNPQRIADLLSMPVFSGPRQRRQADIWFSAIETGQRLPDTELPALTSAPTDPEAMPAPARWPDRDPDAAARLTACRNVVAITSEQARVVAQNLLAGDIVRRLAWQSVQPLTSDTVALRLTELGARPWQTALLAPGLAEALASTAD